VSRARPSRQVRRRGGPSLSVPHGRYDITSDAWFAYVDRLFDTLFRPNRSGKRPRFLRPRQALEVLLDLSAGHAAVNVTTDELAWRMGCSVASADAALKTLEQLDVALIVPDSRTLFRRHIVFTLHPETNRVMEGLWERERLRKHQQDEPKANQPVAEPVPDAPDEDQDPETGPRAIIPLATSFGPLFECREQQRQAIEAARVVHASSTRRHEPA
jgi:hypothetical protein